MQKVFAFLLLLIVLAGSIVPCCPGDDCSNEITLSTTGNEKHEQSGCSPFFACPSCAGFVQTIKRIQVPVPAAQTPVHYQRLTAFSPSAYCSSFFQPPRTAS